MTQNSSDLMQALVAKLYGTITGNDPAIKLPRNKFVTWMMPGIPFGPKYTLESLRNNLRGGKEVTDDVMATVAGFVLFEETQQRKSNRLLNLQLSKYHTYAQFPGSQFLR